MCARAYSLVVRLRACVFDRGLHAHITHPTPAPLSIQTGPARAYPGKAISHEDSADDSDDDSDEDADTEDSDADSDDFSDADY